MEVIYFQVLMSIIQALQLCNDNIYQFIYLDNQHFTMFECSMHVLREWKVLGYHAIFKCVSTLSIKTSMMCVYLNFQNVYYIMHYQFAC
jgi:hypothetical protein